MIEEDQPVMHRIYRLLAAAMALSTLLACSSGLTCPPSSGKGASLLSGTIAVGVTNDSPGFAVGGASGKLSGFDIQVMKALEDPASRRATAATILTVANRAASLKDGHAELVIATFSITSDRKADGIDFAGPYMTTPQALLVRADDNRMNTREDLAGKVVCAVEDTTGHKVTIQDANLDNPAPTTNACVDKLENKLADAVFDDEIILHGFMQARPGKYKIIFPGAFGTIQQYGIAMERGHGADCEAITTIIIDYVKEQWTTDFKAHLTSAVDAYPEDFETRFKPAPSDISRVSCKP
ncbi:transporter substrate-binding domain-containing protein [Nonomuraea bangladeshensis]